MVDGEGIFAPTIDTAVTVPLEDIVAGKVDLFVRKVNVGKKANDRREIKLLVDGSEFLGGIMGKHFGLFQDDQNKCSLSGADADSLIVLV